MKNKRKRKLIEPRIQGRFALLFLSVAAVAAFLHTVLLTYTLNSLAAELPNDGSVVLARIGEILSRSFFLTLALITPLTFALGVSSIFKIVGPLYRFRIFLKQVHRGEKPGPCRIREDDELQDFCELLNEVTAPLRERDEPDVIRPDATKRSAA